MATTATTATIAMVLRCLALFFCVVGRIAGSFFHLLKVINLLIEYLGILSSANALAGRSTPLSAGSGAQACPDGQIHRPFGWFGVAGMPWRADQRLFGRFGGAGMP